jgi:alpha-mannosidase
MPQAISQYLLKTMRVNFYLMDKYPHYVFNWTGAYRYRLMKEYFPSDYAKIKHYVDRGQWFPAGSTMEEGDLNLPSAEAIFRQILYSNTYFRKEFGKASEDFMVPDCFGFPASLPSILAHAGLRGFSTQKLGGRWPGAAKAGGPDSPERTPDSIPFNVGLWEGPDGKVIMAALNPGSYNSPVYYDLSKEPPPVPTPTAEQAAALTPQLRQFFRQAAAHGGRIGDDWTKRIDLDGKVSGVYADYKYVGTGDTGGSMSEESVKALEAIVTKGKASFPTLTHSGRQPISAGPMVQMGDGPVHVISATSDQMFKDIKPEMTSKMPRYKGDLELTKHSAGSLTSQVVHKRWIRKNEILADEAEKASVGAQWLGGRVYPQEHLNDAWALVLGGHFHDTAAGTATPKAYEYAQNDDVIAMNQFANVLTDATEAVASGLDTRGNGTPIVVYNSLNIAREDVVEANISFPTASPKAVRVTGPDGNETPAQLDGNGKVVFLARVPSVGYAVYNVESADAPMFSSELRVALADETSGATLENARYRVVLNSSGDISSIYDKSVGKDLLSAPIRLAIMNDHPLNYPAWNMEFDQEQAPPRAYFHGKVTRIIENGPARVSIEIVKQAEGSRFIQTVSLSAGDAGNRVEISNVADWATLYANVKAVFPLSASNPMATYNWGIGTIQRPNANERSFEVASHQWIDLTDTGGAYGATILTDCKNASDKRDDQTIRLTLIRSPGTDTAFTDQANQDFGHHEFIFGIAGHAGDWRVSQTDWQAQRLNAPLIAFGTSAHEGALGKTFSLVAVDNPRVQVIALKKAETSDEFVIRMVELDGKPQRDVRVKFAGPVTAAREINGQELPVGSATIQNGVLLTSFAPYQPRTFAIKLGAARSSVVPVRSQPVQLAYDSAVASNDDTRTIGGGFDGWGAALPAEMLPHTISFNGIQFKLAAAKTGAPDAVTAKGQTIHLPDTKFNRVYILATATGDQRGTFYIGGKPIDLTIQDWGGMLGQWDTRIWKNDPQTDWAVSANYASWDPNPGKQQMQGSRSWSPRYPEDFDHISPGFIKPAALAWFASHHHTASGLNEPYQYSYLFAYAIEAPANATTLTLPSNEHIRVLAVSIANTNPQVIPVQPLLDTLGRSEPAQQQ